jgi:integrase/recombinase XerD
MVSVPVFTAYLEQTSSSETELEPVSRVWQMFAHQDAIIRHTSAAMVQEREAFLGHLKTRVTYKVLKYYASLLCYIVYHIRPTDPNAVSNEEIAQGAIQWTNTCPSDPEQRIERKQENFRGLARGFYRFLGVYAPSCLALAYQRPFADFARVMATAGYRPATRRFNETLTRKFLDWVAVRREHLAEVQLVDVDDFLFELKEQGRSHRTVVGYCQAFRAFFRFAERYGWSHHALSATIKSPVEHNRKRVLTRPPWNQVRKLIKSLDSSTPELCRAKAIVLLASVYGLRCSEIANLTLDDFDWYNEVLTVRRAKRGRVQQFPLQFEVGEAVLRYLREVRGRSPFRNVFLSLNLAHQPINNLSQTIAKTMKARSVLDPPCGLHGLRHACATELLKKGTSLHGIADLLGHRNLRSVSIYAHCDIHALRRVADFSLTSVL